LTVRTLRGRDITDSVPDLRLLAAALEGRQAVFDGELIAGRGLSGDFYGLGGALRARRRQVAVSFAAFDVLEVDGEPVIGRPYDERRGLLCDLLPTGEAWTVVPPFDHDAAAVFVECVRLGLEGVVAKRQCSRYRPGERSTDWLKCKAPPWRVEHSPRRRPL
jgi:bifunctional non-homologous end joining protein LigD